MEAKIKSGTFLAKSCGRASNPPNGPHHPMNSSCHIYMAPFQKAFQVPLAGAMSISVAYLFPHSLYYQIQSHETVIPATRSHIDVYSVNLNVHHYLSNPLLKINKVFTNCVHRVYIATKNYVPRKMRATTKTKQNGGNVKYLNVYVVFSIFHNKAKANISDRRFFSSYQRISQPFFEWQTFFKYNFHYLNQTIENHFLRSKHFYVILLPPPQPLHYSSN